MGRASARRRLCCVTPTPNAIRLTRAVEFGEPSALARRTRWPLTLPPQVGEAEAQDAMSASALASQFRRLGRLAMLVTKSAGTCGKARVMRSWMSQIVIGIIVTVIGTVIADAILQGGKGRRAVFGAGHFSGPAARRPVVATAAKLTEPEGGGRVHAGKQG